MPKLRRRFGLPLIALVGSVLLLGCAEVVDVPANGYDGDSAVTEIAVADRGEPLDFTAEDADGDPVDSEDLRGQVVLLNFWYAACAPCRVEAPVLEALNTDFAEDVAFYGVNSRDTGGTAASFVETYGVTYPTILDSENKAVTIAVAAAVPVKATPTTVILDREGRVQTVILGEINESVARTLLDDAVTD